MIKELILSLLIYRLIRKHCSKMPSAILQEKQNNFYLKSCGEVYAMEII